MGPGEPRLPSPRQAVLVWLLGVALIVLVGLCVGAVATAIAVREGLRADTAFALISDIRASPLVTSPGWIAASIALNELTVLGLMVAWRRRLHIPFSHVLPLARPSGRALLGALLLPFGFAPLAEVASEAVFRAMPQGVTPDNVVPSLARGTTPLELAGVLALAAVLPAFVEESMFRGFVTTAFRRSTPLMVVLVPSVMFGLFHLEPSQAAGTFVLGCAFGLVRLYTGSLWACVVSHGAYNAVVILSARWLDLPTHQRIHWGYVGTGVLIAIVAHWLLVADLGRRPWRWLGLGPPRGGP